VAALRGERKRKLDSFYGALDRRDITGLVLALGPEAEWHGREEDLQDAPVKDYEGAQRRINTMLDAFDELKTDLIELSEVGANHVVAVVGHTARGRASGAVTERVEYHLWTFEGDTVVRLEEFTERKDALQAAGG
jgi:ketosteroid isomerase-like protein